jgi:hypothetical protein
MRTYACASTDAHMRADNAVGTDFNAAVQLRLGIDQGCWVNQWLHQFKQFA